MSARPNPGLASADLMLIKRMIPHRYPFLMIDKVISMERGKCAIGIKNVTVNEPYFQGHFPDEPVVPGVTIIESMAQTAAVLVNYTLDMIDMDISIYLLGVNKARFRKKVVPGDVLELHVEVLRGGGKVWRLQCRGQVDDTTVAQAEIIATWELNAADD